MRGGGARREAAAEGGREREILRRRLRRYPPQFLDWMRQVFGDPDPFIAASLQYAVAWNVTGFNCDWEPTSQAATPADAAAYAVFLSRWAAALHGIGKELNVDAAAW